MPPREFPPVFLVIPAGGRGVRLGGGTPKQFRDWGGKPLLQATVEAFLQPGMPPLAGIVLSVPPEFIDGVRTWSFGVPCTAVAGGATRQDSVSTALAALPDAPDAAVLIHDAVRPFPSPEPVLEAILALESWDGAVLGEPSTDTLKEISTEGMVLSTLPRERIFRAQTPQVARLGRWREAFSAAAQDGFVGTDDVSLLERLGHRIRLIPSPPSNLKITTPQDWQRWAPQ